MRVLKPLQALNETMGKGLCKFEHAEPARADSVIGVGFAKPHRWHTRAPGRLGGAGDLAFIIKNDPELGRTHLHERAGLRNQKRFLFAPGHPAMITVATFGQLQCAGIDHFVVHHFVTATDRATRCRLRPGEYGFHFSTFRIE